MLIPVAINYLSALPMQAITPVVVVRITARYRAVFREPPMALILMSVATVVAWVTNMVIITAVTLLLSVVFNRAHGILRPAIIPAILQLLLLLTLHQLPLTIIPIAPTRYMALTRLPRTNPVRAVVMEA